MNTFADRPAVAASSSDPLPDVELEDPLPDEAAVEDEDGTEEFVPTPAAPRRSRRWREQAALLLLVLIGVAGLWAFWHVWQGHTGQIAAASSTAAAGRGQRTTVIGTPPAGSHPGQTILSGTPPAGGPGSTGSTGSSGTTPGPYLYDSAIATQALQAVATALDITSTSLSADLQQGRTVAQIASTQHVALSTVNAAYLAAVKVGLSRLVGAGMLEQSQADQLYQQQEQAASQGVYFYLEPAPIPSGGAISPSS